MSTKKMVCLVLAGALMAALAVGCAEKENPYLGRWYPRGEVGFVDFASDGTAAVQEAGTIYTGAYAFSGDKVTVRVTDQTEDLYFLLREDGALYYPKTETVFTREPATDVDFVPTYEGAEAFLGDWVFREDDVILLMLSVYEDGIFSMTDGETVQAGTYTVDGAEITLTAEEEGMPPETMRLLNDVTLYSEAGGLTLILED
jgi:hypothetical protein